jgi:hypothetical protein
MLLKSGPELTETLAISDSDRGPREFALVLIFAAVISLVRGSLCDQGWSTNERVMKKGCKHGESMLGMLLIAKK